MLAGLLFAVHDADDRPGMLTATLPFGGVTLIEYQARLLVAAGASQLVIVVARLSPELLGVIGRIGRRGIAVDTVRSAVEAAEKVHPLARLVMLADGLTTTEDVVAAMTRDAGDALLVIAESDAGASYERVGGGMAWAGVARIDPRRLAELAALPRDYDIQSTLVRLAAQAQAAHLVLPAAALRHGHAIERGGAALALRGRSVLAAMVSGRSGWFDRYLVAPVARLLIPKLVPGGIPAVALAGAAGIVGAAGLAAVWAGLDATGLVLALAGSFGFAQAAILGDLRDERRVASVLDAAAAILPGLAALMLGYRLSAVAGSNTALVVAIAAVAAAALAWRAQGRAPRQLWWASPAALLLVATLGAIAGAPLLGLGAAALYATATVSAGIERLRR